MSIIGSLPDNLSNGTTADASQVMADLNFIVNQVNANAVPIGTLAAPSGTRMIFQQAAAPAGWVTDTSITNHTVLLNQSSAGTIYSAGASYLNFVNGTWSTGSHTLTAGEIPSHTHNVNAATGLFNSGGGGGFLTNATSSTPFTLTTDGGTGGNAGHTHPMGFAWNYAISLVAQKS